MNSWRIPLSFVLIGVLIGFFFTSQLKADVPANSLFPADQLEARNMLIKAFVDEQTLLQKRTVELRREIEDQQKKNEAIISQSKLSALEDLKTKNGFTSLRGPGIKIFLEDSPSAERAFSIEGNQALIQASDLRDVVNFLWASQVEGIMINQQRIVAYSPIVAIGPSILVNNFYLAPPFSVSAVGDPEYLRQRLNDKNILPDLKKRRAQLQIGLQFSIEKQVILPPYAGNLGFKFLQAQ